MTFVQAVGENIGISEVGEVKHSTKVACDGLSWDAHPARATGCNAQVEHRGFPISGV